MTLLVSADEILARRELESQSPDLRALGAHLDGQVAAVLAHPLYVPEQKALLSRWGSHCKGDEAELGFDPFSPHLQRCITCGTEYKGEQQHRWWIYWYQLWLAERVLVMAMRSGQGGNQAGEARALETLALLVERYQQYPNADNVLGPTRPFFSTYLESIWVLQLASATSILDGFGRLPAGLKSDLHAKLFRPSADIISDFDEAGSNRQVWNSTALYALGGILGDTAMRDRAANGPSGMLAELKKGLLADGLWYEGENYHWFVLRGLTWGAQLMRAGGGPDLWTDTGDHGTRFREAFRAPVLTALPDFTFPARRDSKFGVSLRQRRMAELWEMAGAPGHRGTGAPNTEAPGHRGTGAPDFYPSLLRHVYDPSIAEGRENPGFITEVERHEAPTGVRREKLGWKAWLWMTPELADADANAWKPGTTHLEATGLAIFRRDEGATYISVDYGDHGGGHGHPDRLNLTSVIDNVPWLLDFGTGSYVAPSLNWYRSTLAHNAPLVDGQNQHQAKGRCVAFDIRGEYSWICAMLDAETAFDGATVQRSVIATPSYVLDVVQLQSETLDRQLALPWHGLGTVVPDELGLVFTRPDGKQLRIHLSARQPFQVLVQEAPGPPLPSGAAPDLPYPIAIARGESVTLAACLDARGLVEDIDCVEDDFVVRLKDGTVDLHKATEYGWLIEREHGDPIELEGVREESGVATADDLAPKPDEPEAPTHAQNKRLELNTAEQFRRAESEYPGPGEFSAEATLEIRDDTLHVEMDVTAPEPWFRAGDAEDPEWENENPDIHSDGVQVYIEYGGFFGWLIVPDAEDESRVRAAAVKHTDAYDEMITGGSWHPTERGYHLAFDIAFPETITGEFGFDLYVNRGHESRERRTGQLVWSGARGNRLYLAGDRALPGAIPRLKA